uniref:Methyltransferase like 25 n=1 Tax=Cyprinus carpio carpio TaxID=630221 RepID=A0A9J7X9N2_CYPCA
MTFNDNISNAQTVDFYTRDVWSAFMCVSPEEVLCAISSSQDRMRAIEGKSLETLLFLMFLKEVSSFMNCKKAHEVQAVSEVVACLAKCCRVIDVGSGKGYLCSSLSMRSNTHGAQERNRKLKKFSKAYQKLDRATKKQPLDSEDGSKQHCRNSENSDGHKNFITKEKVSFGAQLETSALSKQVTNDLSTSDNAAECPLDPNDSDSGSSFLSMLSLDVIEDVSPRVHPSQLSLEEREKRNDRDSILFSPSTSYITAETEIKTLITELEDAVLVGLHTCGDLAPSTLRMFRAKQELCAVCSVSCCYTCSLKRCVDGVCGFSMSYEKRVGNVYSKASSFVDYVRRALRKLDLDDTTVITKCSHVTVNVFSVCPHVSELHNKADEMNRLKYVRHVEKYGNR